ncbi:MAG: signal peptidase I [Eubacteriales bacterium]|nr:signal peptidase I [Eubacteriales bacterium]
MAVFGLPHAVSGARVARNGREYKRLRAYTWLYSLFAALLFCALFFTLVFNGLRVSDASMAPFFKQGDVLLVSRLSQVFYTPARGDVFAFREADNAIYLGRVLALPHERVAVQNGSVYINGALLDESAYVPKPCADMAELTLDAGMFFLLPDLRPQAAFSPEAFLVPYERLVGRAAFRVAPLESLSVFLKNP